MMTIHTAEKLIERYGDRADAEATLLVARAQLVMAGATALSFASGAPRSLKRLRKAHRGIEDPAIQRVVSLAEELIRNIPMTSLSRKSAVQEILSKQIVGS